MFFIPPTYIELQEKVDQFSLSKEYLIFKADIKSLSNVYDFNYDSPFARNKSNFFDPFHSRRDLDTILIYTMFRDSLYFKNLNHINWLQSLNFLFEHNPEKLWVSDKVPTPHSFRLFY